MATWDEKIARLQVQRHLCKFLLGFAHCSFCGYRTLTLELSIAYQIIPAINTGVRCQRCSRDDIVLTESSQA